MNSSGRDVTGYVTYFASLITASRSRLASSRLKIEGIDLQLKGPDTHVLAYFFANVISTGGRILYPH